MKNVRNGFTLIEIAIVLVVIGLILGMVMKGRSLIDAAQTRSEINKINKLQAAFTSFLSKHNRRPGTSDNTTKAVYEDLIADGMVTAADFEVASLAAYWAFTGCAADTSTPPKTWAWKAYGTANVCLTVSSTPAATNTANAAAPAKTATPRLICFIEGTLDDKNDVTGQGRSSAANTPVIDFNKCDAASETATDYYYRIF